MSKQFASVADLEEKKTTFARLSEHCWSYTADFKGYVTDVHNAALLEHGPCPEHRMRFVNVRRAAGLEPLEDVHNDEVREMSR